MKIGIASDHGGYELKELLIEYLEEKSYDMVDYGTDSPESVDYPDYAEKLCSGIISKEVDQGIAICGTGIGISIACNKIDGILAAHCTDTFSARAAKNHNNANVLCLGARISGVEIAKDIVDNFLASQFDGGRHERRVMKIKDLERRA